MYIPVVLAGGHEELVRKDELQLLMFTKKIVYFKRTDGWALLGRNKMRNQRAPLSGVERRQHEVFSLEH